jgi:hypothetical protein
LRDVWDEPDDSAQLRAQAEACERRLWSSAVVLGVLLRDAIAAERQHAQRERTHPR